MSNLKNKRVITAALCGSWATKDMNPAVPYTPEEIARDAYECWKAGAAIVHIHVRNADGSPSTKFELYKETIERIRAFPDCDVCLNITSSGSVDFGDEERIYPLQQLLPELAQYVQQEPGSRGISVNDLQFYSNKMFDEEKLAALNEALVKLN